MKPEGFLLLLTIYEDELKNSSKKGKHVCFRSIYDLMYVYIEWTSPFWKWIFISYFVIKLNVIFVHRYLYVYRKKVSPNVISVQNDLVGVTIDLKTTSEICHYLLKLHVPKISSEIKTDWNLKWIKLAQKQVCKF